MRLRNCIIIIVLGCSQLGYGMDDHWTMDTIDRTDHKLPEPKRNDFLLPYWPPRLPRLPQMGGGSVSDVQNDRLLGKTPDFDVVQNASNLVINNLPGDLQRYLPGDFSGDFQRHHFPRGRKEFFLSEKTQVNAYLEQNKSNLIKLLKLFERVRSDILIRDQAHYLESLQNFYAQGNLPQIFTSFARNFSLAAADKTGLSLVPWMIFIIDSFSFAEQLSTVSSATQLERNQFQLSLDDQSFYKKTRTELVSASEKFLSIVQSVASDYSSLFSGVAKKDDYPPEKLEALSIGLQKVEDLLQFMFEERDKYVSWIMEHSLKSKEVLLWKVIDEDAGVAAWKQQEQFHSKDILSVFPSYKSFMSDFLFSNVKISVENYIGQEPGKFATVQDLVSALDQMAFMLESTTFSFAGYSEKVVQEMIKVITEAYPDTYVPSKKFIINYCASHKAFKSTNYFIPNIEHFFTDIETLTIEELAKKYGQGSESIQGLLDNVYEVAYILQRTDHIEQVNKLMALAKKIMTLYPDLSPTVVKEMVAVQNLPLRLIFDSQLGLTEMLATAQKELFIVMQGGIKKSISGLSAALYEAAVELNMQQIQRSLGMVGSDILGGVNLKSSLQLILKELNAVEDTFKQEGAAVLLGSTYGATFQRQFSLLKKNAIKIGLDAAYQQAKKQQDKIGDKLVSMVKDFTRLHFLMPKLPRLWGTAFMNYQATLKSFNSWMSGFDGEWREPDDSEDVNSLVLQIAAKSALEKENESDFRACIWASNKMGMMESKVKCMESLIKIKTTPLFISGYKNVLKDLKADLQFLYSSRRVQKCLNVIARRVFLSKDIKSLEAHIEEVQKKNDELSSSNEPDEKPVL